MRSRREAIVDYRAKTARQANGQHQKYPAWLFDEVMDSIACDEVVNCVRQHPYKTSRQKNLSDPLFHVEK